MKFNKETVSTIGAIKLASGTITDPVEFLDITLPVGYMMFQLSLNSFLFSTFEIICLAVSADNGVSFVNDSSNIDSYFAMTVASSTGLGGLNNNSGDYFDALMNFSSFSIDPDNEFGGNMELEFNPGSNKVLFNGFARHGSYSELYSRFQMGTAWFGLNPEATIPPTASRINLVRILPYGNTDANPPTSGETITAGSWILFGVPTP